MLTQRIDWPSSIAEAREVVAEVGSVRGAAKKLAAKWGHPVSRDALRNALGRAPEAATAVVAAPVSGAPLALILSDLHIPEHDEPALRAVLAWIAAHQPSHIILAGDVGEWESCSQHGTSPDAPSFLADAAAVREVLVRLQRAAPGARTVLLEGNHETRLSRMVVSRTPNLTGACTVPDALGLADLGIEWVPEDRQPYSLGALRILHGHQVVARWAPRHVAAKLCDVYGVAGEIAVMGHVHRTQRFRRPVLGGYADAVTLPCLRSLRPSWLAGREAGWSLGCGIATLGDRTALDVVDIEGGGFWWGGKRYG
jgi:metallophosphoesterase superfamily enzyme